MDIKMNNISVRAVFEGYSDNGVGGVRGYSDKLNIRPVFQRECRKSGK